MADQLLAGLGIEISAAGVAAHHGARQNGGLLDGWLVDVADADQLPAIELSGVTCRAVPLWMNDEMTTDRLVRDTLDLASAIGRQS